MKLTTLVIPHSKIHGSLGASAARECTKRLGVALTALHERIALLFNLFACETFSKRVHPMAVSRFILVLLLQDSLAALPLTLLLHLCFFKPQRFLLGALFAQRIVSDDDFGGRVVGLAFPNLPSDPLPNVVLLFRSNFKNELPLLAFAGGRPISYLNACKLDRLGSLARNKLSNGSAAAFCAEFFFASKA